mgnify:CR=1 FL=1
MKQFARVALLLLPIYGCREEPVAVYDVPREAPAPRPGSGPALSSAEGPAVRARAAAPEVTAAEAGASSLAWTVPAGWKAKPASSMRLATFEISAGGATVDLSVVAIPGEAGGVLANVNRWRGQLGLAEVAEDGLARVVERVACPAGALRVVDFTGKGDGEPARMVVALISHGGQTWFFKATGSPEAVGAAKPALLAFLKSVHAAR